MHLGTQGRHGRVVRVQPNIRHGRLNFESFIVELSNVRIVFFLGDNKRGRAAEQMR